MNASRWAWTVLILLNSSLVLLGEHLAFFAAEGARYTAEDGRQDRAIALSRDTTLATRIEALEQQRQ